MRSVHGDGGCPSIEGSWRPLVVPLAPFPPPEPKDMICVIEMVPWLLRGRGVTETTAGTQSRCTAKRCSTPSHAVVTRALPYGV